VKDIQIAKKKGKRNREKEKKVGYGRKEWDREPDNRPVAGAKKKNRPDRHPKVPAC